MALQLYNRAASNENSETAHRCLHFFHVEKMRTLPNGNALYKQQKKKKSPARVKKKTREHIVLAVAQVHRAVHYSSRVVFTRLGR